jgi:flagellar assembly protein FliH
MFREAEPHKAELKIRRMEYRAAHVAMPAVLKSNPPALDEPSHEILAAKLQEVQREQMQQDRILELEQKLVDRESLFALQLDAARKEAFEQGCQDAESEHAALFRKIGSAIEDSLKQFLDARDTYFAQVEQEVVRLALSIATRILHREAQMDPLLLAGAVRVALGQLSESTDVRLRVPAAEYELWSEMVRLMPNLPLRPQLIADDLLGSAACSLETHLGSVDLGVRAQLAEIERGFFDLLERRDIDRRDASSITNERKEA